jgi:hypothetical protein
MTNKNYTIPSDITVAIEVITPSSAKKLLEGNTDNRKLRKHRVAQYTDAMKRGLWEIQNDAITISKSGKLLNGQHRLTAIVESNQPCQCLVLRGVDDSAYTSIDSGLGRSVNDALAAAGMPANATHITPMARTMICMEAGLNPMDSNSMSLVQRHDIVEYVNKNDEMLDWALSLSRRADGAVGGIRHAWGVFAILAAQKHGREKVDTFINLVIDGAGLKPGESPLALRNWLSRQRGQWSRQASKTNIAVYISAFNKWMTREKTLVIKPFGGAWENFPEVVD